MTGPRIGELFSDYGYLGIEVDERYCELIAQRLSQDIPL